MSSHSPPADTSSSVVPADTAASAGSDDPSIPPVGPSLLLSLPRELRDAIYEYALTEEDGLIATPTYEIRDGELCIIPRFTTAQKNGDCEMSHHGEGDIRPNQLRLVNRQLHTETCGLELGFNDLTFPSTGGMTGTILFQDFLTHFCSTRNQARIKKVIIHESAEEDPREVPGASDIGTYYNSALKALFDHFTVGPIRVFCDTNSACEIIIHLAYFNSSRRCSSWIKFGTPLQWALHGTVPAHLDPWFQNNKALMILLKPTESLPPNAKFRVSWDFDEVEFRKGVSKTHGTPERCLTNFFPHIQKWATEGF